MACVLFGEVKCAQCIYKSDVDHGRPIEKSSLNFMLKWQNSEVVRVQEAEWQPIIDWVNERYDVTLTPSSTIFAPPVSPKDMDKLRKHLLSYDNWALSGH